MQQVQLQKQQLCTSHGQAIQYLVLSEVNRFACRLCLNNVKETEQLKSLEDISRQIKSSRSIMKRSFSNCKVESIKRELVAKVEMLCQVLSRGKDREQVKLERLYIQKLEDVESEIYTNPVVYNRLVQLQLAISSIERESSLSNAQLDEVLLQANHRIWRCGEMLSLIAKKADHLLRQGTQLKSKDDLLLDEMDAEERLAQLKLSVLLTNHLRDVKEDLVSVDEHRQELLLKVTAFEKKIETLATNLSAQMYNNRKQCQQMQHTKSKHEYAIRQLNEECSTLRNLHSEQIRSITANYEQYQRAASKKLMDQINITTVAHKQLADTRGEANKLKDNAKIQQDAIGELERKIKLISEQLRQETGKNTQLQERMKDLIDVNTQLTSQKEQLEYKISAFQCQVVTLKQDLQKYWEQTQGLNTQLDHLIRQRDILKGDIDRETKQLAAAQQLNMELREKIGSLGQQVQGYVVNCGEKQQEILTMESRMHECQTQLSSLNKELQNVNMLNLQLQQQIKQLQKSLSERVAQISRQYNEKKEFQSAVQSLLKGSDTQIQQLSAQLQQARRAKEETATKMHLLKSEKDKAEHRYLQLQQQSDLKIKNLEEKHNVFLQQMEAWNDELRDKNDKCRLQLQTLQRANADLEEKSKSIQDSLKKLTSEHTSMVQEIQTYQSEISRLLQVNQRLQLTSTTIKQRETVTSAANQVALTKKSSRPDVEDRLTYLEVGNGIQQVEKEIEQTKELKPLMSTQLDKKDQGQQTQTFTVESSVLKQRQEQLLTKPNSKGYYFAIPTMVQSSIQLFMNSSCLFDFERKTGLLEVLNCYKIVISHSKLVFSSTQGEQHLDVKVEQSKPLLLLVCCGYELLGGFCINKGTAHEGSQKGPSFIFSITSDRKVISSSISNVVDCEKRAQIWENVVSVCQSRVAGQVYEILNCQTKEQMIQEIVASSRPISMSYTSWSWNFSHDLFLSKRIELRKYKLISIDRSQYSITDLYSGMSHYFIKRS